MRRAVSRLDQGAVMWAVKRCLESSDADVGWSQGSRQKFRRQKNGEAVMHSTEVAVREGTSPTALVADQ
ncbi:hypothetical protein NDU88_011564 [Pleurodeles waltl]|uniref:Uncharacterized protein n=1 Tax=Pleurodeles waltl TaxID=8319 RepID=A0AAV7S2M7_PLEWA|nr:hypothetical protein NDU88_011564 [Pleurodeles waltl]